VRSSWDTFDNIRFSMNVHTFGEYFMWAPGAYELPGREPLERPSVGIEQHFFEVSQTILGRIAEHRGTFVEPTRTGPIIDVLYSAAGNSADDVWYTSTESGQPIFASNFEAGADPVHPSRLAVAELVLARLRRGGLRPDDGVRQRRVRAARGRGRAPSGRHAADLVGQRDQRWVVRGSGRRRVHDQRATLHYTTDGSRPTFDSPRVERRDARDSAAPVRIDRTTTLRWFAVDAVGNVEGGYDPDGNGQDYRRVQIRIR
jgi:hypothetical protein